MDYAGQRRRRVYYDRGTGVVGAVVGGYISTFFGMGRVDGFNLGSFVVAVIGALVVLLSTGRSKAKQPLLNRVAAAALFVKSIRRCGAGRIG